MSVPVLALLHSFFLLFKVQTILCSSSSAIFGGHKSILFLPQAQCSQYPCQYNTFMRHLCSNYDFFFFFKEETLFYSFERDSVSQWPVLEIRVILKLHIQGNLDLVLFPDFGVSEKHKEFLHSFQRFILFFLAILRVHWGLPLTTERKLTECLLMDMNITTEM